MENSNYKDIPITSESGRLTSIDLSIRIYGDLFDEVSGNKSFKLRLWLDNLGADEIVVSFGGAFSNHLLALSAQGKRDNFKTIGIIRGDEPAVLSPYLLAMQRNGMVLRFISREEYRQKESSAFLSKLQAEYPNCRIVPEGGAGMKGVEGAMHMVNSTEPYDYVFLPGATATTLAGVAKKLKGSSTRVGCVQVLKGEQILKNELFRTANVRLEDLGNVEIFEHYHFGGYAKWNAELLEFQRQWMAKTGIPLDLVYGTKAMFGLFDLAQSSYFPPNASVLYLHTGGLGPVSLMADD